VIWEAPPRDSNKGAVQRYKIRWEPLVAEDGVDGEVIQEANRHRSFTIEHLQTWTEYKIWVSAGNSKGFGPESSPVVVKTGEDGEIQFILTSAPNVHTHRTAILFFSATFLRLVDRHRQNSVLLACF